MKEAEHLKRDVIAQWAFDTKSIMSRFNLELEDVDVTWFRGEPAAEFTKDIAFFDGQMERMFCMVMAITALGTQLYGPHGCGRGLEERELNLAKKAADAVSAYAMSEGLWQLARWLPENHAILVGLGEGLMPKEGQRPEVGSNPLLGFGRVYARPTIAKWLEQRVVRLLNEPDYGWVEFYQSIKDAKLTVWGAAIDTLENTSRFALGEESGPMSILHVFDQPLKIVKPYEGFMGCLVLPREISELAAERSLLVDYRTPRGLIVEVICELIEGIKRENIHVWTLRGPNRARRIEKLWEAWREAGADIIDHGWSLPNGRQSFADSGTYAPTFRVGRWQDQDGAEHLFLVDGYSASTETIQAASLAPMLGLDAFLTVFTSRFSLPCDLERKVMRLDPEQADFDTRLAELVGDRLDSARRSNYRQLIREVRLAGIDLGRSVSSLADFLPEKEWRMAALNSYIGADPYTGSPGVERIDGDLYRVTVRLATELGEKRVGLTLRFQADPLTRERTFKPLLARFMEGEDYRSRPVRTSDSGRIRNELQTICSEALRYSQDGCITVHFDLIPDTVITYEKQQIMLEVLGWCKTHHPLWFRWLNMVPPSAQRRRNSNSGGVSYNWL